MWAAKTPRDYYLVETIKSCDSQFELVTVKMNPFKGKREGALETNGLN